MSESNTREGKGINGTGLSKPHSFLTSGRETVFSKDFGVMCEEERMSGLKRGSATITSVEC